VKRIRRFFVAIIALVILIVVLLAVLFGLVGSATQPVTATATAFMTAIQNSNFQAAYDLLTPEKQAGLSIAAFSQAIPAGSLGEWRLPNQSISTVAGQGSEGRVSGTGVFGSIAYTVRFTLHQVGNEWRIATYTFTPN
jgi:hypothetical protein